MTGPALLIVEDEGPVRRALTDYLERRGYVVYEAATAHEAMRQWDAHRADLVLLDLGLPDLDGADVIRRIRRESTTPIIILSARGDERDKIAGLDSLMAEAVNLKFIPAPLTKEQIAELIQISPRK